MFVCFCKLQFKRLKNSHTHTHTNTRTQTHTHTQHLQTHIILNRADSSPTFGSEDIGNMFWLAQRFNKPACSYTARQAVTSIDKFYPWQMLYYTSAGSASDVAALPQTALYKLNSNDTVLRSKSKSKRAATAAPTTRIVTMTAAAARTPTK